MCTRGDAEAASQQGVCVCVCARARVCVCAFVGIVVPDLQEAVPLGDLGQVQIHRVLDAADRRLDERGCVGRVATPSCIRLSFIVTYRYLFILIVVSRRARRCPLLHPI